MWIFLIIASNWLFSSPVSVPVPPTVNRENAQKAFVYLNKIRVNPNAYSKEMNLDMSSIEKRAALKWNPILAKVAEEKAMDMATRRYFDHKTPEGYGINYLIDKAGYELVKDWLNPKSKNYFESIEAGTSNPEECIRILIVDDGTPDVGHRNHLLGISEWNAGLYDIGIGIVSAPGSMYGTYTSIIIAKHNW